MTVTYSTIGFAPIVSRRFATWRGQPMGHVLDGSVPEMILGDLLSATERGALSAVEAIPYAEWVHLAILPLLASRVQSACVHSRPELACGAASAGEPCHVGCEAEPAGRSTSSSEVAHWHAITFLSNHLGGEGTAIVYDIDPFPNVPVPVFRPLDAVKLPWRRRAQLVPVLGRTIVLNSSLPYELLPTIKPYAAVSMCLSIEGVAT
jgi:hypothetical protein